MKQLSKMGGIFDHMQGAFPGYQNFPGSGWLVKATQVAQRKVEYVPKQVIFSRECVLPPGGLAQKEQALVEGVLNKCTNAIELLGAVTAACMTPYLMLGTCSHPSSKTPLQGGALKRT